MNNFEKNVIGVHQEKGILWLKELSNILDKCKIKWDITSLTAFENLSYNFVAKVIISKKEFVLKVGVKCDELYSEIETLKLYQTEERYVKLFDYDLELGALLLEYISSGLPLSKIDDKSATIIAADLIKEKYLLPSKQYKSLYLKDWVRGFKKLKSYLNDINDSKNCNLINKAEEEFLLLCESTKDNVVLHGDLHHDNIISSGSSWKIIDPKGIIGDRAFEPSAFLRNYLKDKVNPQEVLKDRIAVFSKTLNIDSERIRRWSFAKAVLSSCWSYEDNLENWKQELEFAYIFMKI